MLAKYAQALAAFAPPKAYAFEYSYEHHGERPQDRASRVYRQGQHEREEILSVNGQKLAPPQIRIFDQHRDRYAVSGIAPKPEAYLFTYVGSQANGKHRDYVFDTAPHAPGAYVVVQVTIDGLTFLPRKVSFKTESKGVEGTGQITYDKFDRYWMPTGASARATIRTKLESERLAFAHYRFFPGLPPTTFAKPATQ